MSYWYQKFVDRFFENQQLVGQMNTTGTAMPEFKPFITVSRDPGSGGKPIAKLVAKKLGFEFYDKKLISDIAKSAKTRKDILEDIDEKKRSQMEDLIHNLLNPEYVSERRYIKNLCKVVLSLAQKGSVVLLGRGSNFITPNAFGFHVRITAPYRVCVSRAVEYENVPYQKAREIIHEVMKERADFVKQYFGKDISSAKYYDMTLNTTYFTIEQAAQIVVSGFKKKFQKSE